MRLLIGVNAMIAISSVKRRRGVVMADIGRVNRRLNQGVSDT